MASKKTPQLLRGEILDNVSLWLKEEHETRLGSKANLQNVQPAIRRANILTSELPDRWDAFQKLHTVQEQEFSTSKRRLIDRRLLLRVGLNALQCAAIARESFVWTAVTQGFSVDAASDISWKVLDEYRADMRWDKVQLPSARRLIMPIQDAVKDESAVDIAGLAYGHPKITFIGAVGLAASAIHEQSMHKYGRYTLPSPTSEGVDVAVWTPNTQNL